jgi:hypothetical protein
MDQTRVHPTVLSCWLLRGMQETENAILQSIIRFVWNGQDFNLSRGRTRGRNSRFVELVEKTSREFGPIYMHALCFSRRYEDTGLDIGERLAGKTPEGARGMAMTDWENCRKGVPSNRMCAGDSTLLFLG